MILLRLFRCTYECPFKVKISLYPRIHKEQPITLLLYCKANSNPSVWFVVLKGVFGDLNLPKLPTVS